MEPPTRVARIANRALACLITAFACACADVPHPPMRVATDIWIGNEMLAVADRAGLFNPADIRRVEYSSNQEILRALRNGLVESAALMLDEALVAMHDGADLVIVAAVDVSNGSDAVIARPPIKTLAELKGRRVGVQLNSAGLQILYRALAQAQMSIKDIIVVNVPPDRHLLSFIGDDVDAENVQAIVTYDPMRTIMLERGGVDLFNSSAIPGDVVNVLVVRRDYLAANPDRGRALVNAWFGGAAEFRASAEAREWVAHRQGLSSAKVAQALSTTEVFDAARSRAMIASGASLAATARRFHFFMRENGRLSRDIPVDRLFELPPGFQP
jgi:NitT/TauT family transport system substrate-binding protein